MMDRATFRQGMTLLVSTWPDRSPSPETTTAYFEALRHLHPTVFAEAVMRCIRYCTFFPVPAEIIKHAEAALTAAGLLPLEGESAWINVLNVAKRWHPAIEPQVWNSVPLERALRECGGLRAIALADDDDVPWLRKTFVDRYTVYRRREIDDSCELMAQPLPAPDNVTALPLRNQASA